MSKYQYDLFVIGAGSGGVRAARMSASYGAKVAVAEDSYLGGTCVNVGCVPKKLFYYGAHFHDHFEEASAYGWQIDDISHDWPTLRDNKTKEIERLNGIYQRLLENSGVDLINGRASIVDENTVEVAGEKYSCAKILIATGGKPFVPDFKGSEHALVSDDLFYLEKLPKKVLVVGGGYIAIEFAGIFKGLGSDVQLSYRGDLFLRGFDQEIREKLHGEVSKKGVDVQFNSSVKEIEKLADERKAVTFADGTTETFDQVVYATGRVPRVEGLGLDNVGVETTDKGSIIVDDYFHTNVKSIFAIGDVIDRVQLTPVAIGEAMVLARNLFIHKVPREKMDYHCIPSAVFSNPNFAGVGLTEEEARAQVGEISVFTSEFRHLKHTLTSSDEKVFMKLIVDKMNDRVLGAHMIGGEAGEIIQGIAIALKMGATKAQLDATVGIHPTAAEEFVTMREATR